MRIYLITDELNGLIYRYTVWVNGRKENTLVYRRIFLIFTGINTFQNETLKIYYGSITLRIGIGN